MQSKSFKENFFTFRVNKRLYPSIASAAQYFGFTYSELVEVLLLQSGLIKTIEIKGKDEALERFSRHLKCLHETDQADPELKSFVESFAAIMKLKRKA